MGIATLLVLIFHGNEFAWPEALHPICLLIGEGNAGVDIFLFLSAVGLYFSMQKKQNALSFYRRRFLRLIPSYLIIAIPLYAVLVFALGSRSIREYFIMLSSVGFWLPNQRGLSPWYVAFIIPVYALYPLLHQLLGQPPARKRAGLAALLALSVLLELLLGSFCRNYYAQTEIAVCRIPVFLLGCSCAKLVYENKSDFAALPFAAISAILFIAIRAANRMCIDRQSLLFGSIVRKSKIFSALAIIAFFCAVFSYISAGHKEKQSKLLRILSFFGRHSFEAYIVHRLLADIYERTPLYAAAPQFWVYYLGILPLSLIIAVGARRLADMPLARHKPTPAP